MESHGFCGYCGAKFEVGQPWPRVCGACGNVTYRNPLRLEYTVITPGSSDRGARRIIAGEAGERYYTDDHYDSFYVVVEWP